METADTRVISKPFSFRGSEVVILLCNMNFGALVFYHNFLIF